MMRKPKPAQNISAKDIASECLGFQIRLLNRVVTSMFTEALRPHGIHASQFDLLVAISVAGSVRAADLAGPMQMSRSTLSRNLDRMKAAGWVAYLPDPDDARARKVAITVDGQAVLKAARSAWRQVQVDVQELLGQEVADALEDGAQRAKSAGRHQ